MASLTAAIVKLLTGAHTALLTVTFTCGRFEAFSYAVKCQIDAEVELRNAMGRAIDAKMAVIQAHIAIAEAESRPERAIQKLYAQIRVLGRNRRSMHKFANAPLDTSWWARLINV